MRAILAILPLALGVGGLAELAAADNGDDCVAGASPVPSGFYRACLFEENASASSYDYCNWSGCYKGGESSSRNDLLAVALAEDLGDVEAGATAGANQYERTQWYENRVFGGHVHGTSSTKGTQVGATWRVATPAGVVAGSAGLLQYDWQSEDCSAAWGCMAYDDRTTLVSASQSAGPGAFGARLQQSDRNDTGCFTFVLVSTPTGNYGPPSGPCPVVIPHLTDDPATRLPDWPDGTGLPFL